MNIKELKIFLCLYFMCLNCFEIFIIGVYLFVGGNFFFKFLEVKLKKIFEFLLFLILFFVFI